MQNLRDFFLSDGAGNLGGFLSGVSIFVAMLTYFFQKKLKSIDETQKKASYTFYYSRKIQEYHEKFFFLRFHQYVESTLVYGIPLNEIIKNNIKITGAACESVIRQDAADFFLLLREVKFLLQQNRDYNPIDVKEFGGILKSYTSQIKDFFSVVEIFIARERKQPVADGFGAIREDDFISLKIFFQRKYDFLR